MDAVSAQRALLLSQDEALAGNSTLSLETQQDECEYRFSNYVEESFAEFIRHIRKLPLREQELLLSYYLLSVSQTRLAKIQRSTQTITSSDIRRATSAMAAIMLFGGDIPSAELMAPVLKRAVLEEQTMKPEWGSKRVEVKASELIAAFALCRSYAKVAEDKKLFRADVRRCLRILADKLVESQQAEEQALGSWLTVLVEKSSAGGTGYTSRQQAKFAPMYRKDSPILGEFRVDVTHPDFEELFSPHATF